MNFGLDWHANSFAWLVTLVCVVGSGLQWQAMLRDRARRGAKWPVGRLVLRCLVFALLAIVSWRPSVVSSARGDLSKPVTILVDNSTSMLSTDPDRSPGEALRIAIAFGEIPASVRDRPAGRLLRQLVSLEQVWHSLDELQRRPSSTNAAVANADVDRTTAEATNLLSAIREQTTDPALQAEIAFLPTAIGNERSDSSTAFELRRLIDDLSRRESQADDALARDDPLCRAAASSVVARTRYELASKAAAILAEQFQPPGRAQLRSLDGSRISVKPNAPAEQQVGSLTQALRKIIASNDQSTDIVLLSDGRSTDNWANASSAMAGSRASIDTLALAARGPTAMVRVNRIDVRRQAFVRESLPVTVRIQNRGPSNREALVTLGDGLTSQTATLRLASGDNEQKFVWNVTSSARLHLTARATLLDTGRPATGEAAAEVRVIDQKVRVLLLTSDPAAVAPFRKAMVDQPWIEFSTISQKGLSVQFYEEKIAAADVVVCGAMEEGSTGIFQSVALRSAVERGGKPLLILPNPSMSTEAFTLPEPVRALLPFRVPSPISRRLVSTLAQKELPSAIVVPTPEAQDAGIIDANIGYDAVVRQWLLRPPVQRPRDFGPLNDRAQPLLVDRETRLPVLIESSAGIGRVFTVTSTDVYQWADEQDLWPSLVRSLFDLPATDSITGMSVHMDPGPVTLNDRVQITIQVADQDRTPITARVIREDDFDEPLELRESPPGSNRFLATFVPETPGAIDVDVVQGSRMLQSHMAVRPADPEVADTTPDPGLLRRIAEITGGNSYFLDQIAQTSESLNDRRTNRTTSTILPIWCSGFMFVCIVGLLGVEWAVRKQAGLV